MTDTLKKVNELLEERILVIDGAMGTLIQDENLNEQDFRGDLFKDHPHDLKGGIVFNDVPKGRAPFVFSPYPAVSDYPVIEEVCDYDETHEWKGSDYDGLHHGLESRRHQGFRVHRLQE